MDQRIKFTTLELIKHSFDDVRGEHIRAIFSTRRLAYSTSLVIFCYAALGLAYPLFNGFLGTYLAEKNASFGNTNLNSTYAGYTYQAACGVPGSMLAAVTVEWGRGGRKFAMAFFTISAGVFLFGLTRARNGTTINVLTCFASFFENAFCECSPHYQKPCLVLRLAFDGSRLPVMGLTLCLRRRTLRLCPRSLPHAFSGNRRCSSSRCISDRRYLRACHRSILESCGYTRWSRLRLSINFRRVSTQIRNGTELIRLARSGLGWSCCSYRSRRGVTRLSEELYGR